MDFERIGAVGGLLLTNLILLQWMTKRLTRDMRVNQTESTSAIHLLVLEIAGLRNDLTALLIDKDHKEVAEVMERMSEIRQRIAAVQAQLSVKAGS